MSPWRCLLSTSGPSLTTAWPQSEWTLLYLTRYRPLMPFVGVQPSLTLDTGKSAAIPFTAMKSLAESSTEEVLAGLVERVTFHNAETGFCVLRAKARGHRDVVTVVGHAATISAGEWITAS